jgi:hypothetical protein
LGFILKCQVILPEGAGWIWTVKTNRQQALSGLKRCEAFPISLLYESAICLQPAAIDTKYSFFVSTVYIKRTNNLDVNGTRHDRIAYTPIRSVDFGWILIVVLNGLVIDLLLFTIYYLAMTVYVVLNGNLNPILSLKDTM